jgi:hypothetical protein
MHVVANLWQQPFDNERGFPVVALSLPPLLLLSLTLEPLLVLESSVALGPEKRMRAAVEAVVWARRCNKERKAVAAKAHYIMVVKCVVCRRTSQESTLKERLRQIVCEFEKIHRWELRTLLLTSSSPWKDVEVSSQRYLPSDLRPWKLFWGVYPEP